MINQDVYVQITSVNQQHALENDYFLVFVTDFIRLSVEQHLKRLQPCLIRRRKKKPSASWKLQQMLQIISSFPQFWTKLFNLHSCIAEPSTESISLLFVATRNKQVFSQFITIIPQSGTFSIIELHKKPKTTSSKSRYLLSPSVAGAWEGGLCAQPSEEGNQCFGTDKVKGLNKTWNLSPNVYFTSHFPHRFMKTPPKELTCFRCKYEKCIMRLSPFHILFAFVMICHKVGLPVFELLLNGT